MQIRAKNSLAAFKTIVIVIVIVTRSSLNVTRRFYTPDVNFHSRAIYHVKKEATVTSTIWC